jgi:flagellar hook assembly protein FlgD
MSPNPFTGRTHVAYAVGAEGQEVDMAVFDLAGRRVRQLASGVQSVGRHDVDWDGRSESGQVVEGGVYFLRARVGRETRVMPLVHMR